MHAENDEQETEEEEEKQKERKGGLVCPGLVWGNAVCSSMRKGGAVREPATHARTHRGIGTRGLPAEGVAVGQQVTQEKSPYLESMENAVATSAKRPLSLVQETTNAQEPPAKVPRRLLLRPQDICMVVRPQGTDATAASRRPVQAS
ncbi:hypothetical protein O3P69_002707 [Scylla paramamosain]|uniref:Uncharacterized protein n=1 Tax=Scylla paramamosain TaxID=85552 RepID=A0AAW0UPK3_SCYPA